MAPANGDAAAPSASEAKAGAATRQSRSGAVLQSIVKVRTRAVPNGAQQRDLGQEREGTDVVIGDDVIVTVGYLIVEADEVEPR